MFVRAFRIPLINYFDDFAGGGPRGLAQTALWYFVEFRSLIGAKCKYEKCDFGNAIDFLGLRMAGGLLPVTASLPGEKREAYLSLIAEMLASGSCTPPKLPSWLGS